MRRLLPFYVVVFIGFVGYSIQIPIFTSMFLDSESTFIAADKVALRKILLGLMLCTYPIGQFLGAPILGALSDRLGRRPILIVSLIFATIFYAIISFTISFFHFFWLYLLLFLTGLAEGNIALSQGGITDIVKEEDRSKYFGYNYVFASTAYIVGPLLSSFFGNSEIISWFGPATAFWVVTLLMLATTIWIILRFKETHTPSTEQNGTSYFQEFTNLAQVFKDKKLRYFYGINFLIYLAIFGFFRSYSIYLVEMFHVDLSMLSLMVAYVSIPMIFMNLAIIPYISKFLAPKSWAMISSFLMGVFMISIVCFPFWTAIWITLFITTAAIAMSMTFSVSVISLLAKKERQGSVMGNNQSLLSLAEGISAALAGILAAIFVWLPLALLGIFGMAAAYLLYRKHENSNTKELESSR